MTIDIVKWGTYATDYTAGDSPSNPRVDSSGYLWVHGLNGFYVYATSGPTVGALLASDTTRTRCLDSIELGGYIHMVNANNGINAYSWDGTTLTRIATKTWGNFGVCTDGTYIYGNTGTSLFKMTFDGSAYTLVAYKAALFSYNLIHLGGYIWGAVSGSPGYLARQKVNMTSTAGTYSDTYFDPETVCTDGTYVYTDNMETRDYHAWKFQAGSGSSITYVSKGGTKGYGYNSRGICWDSSRSWVLVSGQMNEQVYAYNTSLALQGKSLARDYIQNNRGIFAGNGYIYDTSGGTSVWGYGDIAGQSGQRAQAVWMT